MEEYNGSKDATDDPSRSGAGTILSEPAPETRAATAAQLTIPLVPHEPHSLRFFVAHSGVAQAYALMQQAIDGLKRSGDQFRSIFLWGPEGVGKSHLVQGTILDAIARGVAPEQLCLFDLTPDEPRLRLEKDPEEFVSEYERLRSSGGLILVTSRQPPDLSTANPHLLSRFHAGSVERLSFAQEEELRALLEALFERRNLRVSSRTLDFMIHRLPTDPLSFHRIVAKIDGFLWTEGGTPSVHTIKRALLSDTPHR